MIVSVDVSHTCVQPDIIAAASGWSIVWFCKTCGAGGIKFVLPPGKE